MFIQAHHEEKDWISIILLSFFGIVILMGMVLWLFGPHDKVRTVYIGRDGIPVMEAEQ